ncbi:YihY/virulence factor BrkB family protein [Intestinibacillus massiliensis]|nr:YihY/virulence factor BrkB family protein [Intestinibacillus massiliensis]
MQKSSRLGYVLRQMFRRYFSDGVSQSAAELAYFLLFSFFPLLMFLNSVLARMNLSAESLNTVTQFMPHSLQTMIQSYVEYITTQPSISPLVIGIGLTLFFLSRAMRSLMRTANRIYRVELRVGGLYQGLLSLLFTAGFLLAIIGSFLIVVIGRTSLRLIGKWLPIPGWLDGLAHSGGYWLAIAFIFVFLMLFNRMVPNIRLAWHEVLPGALFSMLTWFALSIGFSFYVDNMARYSILYGSLGAMIVLMLWLYLTGTVMIMGTQLNHIIMVMRRYREHGDAHPGGMA